jgi:Domain of unknown function (DUF6458)
VGIGTGLAFIALGAILAFATHFSTSGIDIRMVGWILMLLGAAMLIITIAYTRPRKRRRVTEIIDVDQPLLEPEEDEPPTVIRRAPIVSGRRRDRPPGE